MSIFLISYLQKSGSINWTFIWNPSLFSCCIYTYSPHRFSWEPYFPHWRLVVILTISKCSWTFGSDGVLDIEVATLSDGLNGILMWIYQGLDCISTTHCDVTWFFGTLVLIVTSLATSETTQRWSLIIETVEMRAVRKVGVRSLVLIWQIWLHLEI